MVLPVNWSTNLSIYTWKQCLQLCKLTKLAFMLHGIMFFFPALRKWTHHKTAVWRFHWPLWEFLQWNVNTTFSVLVREWNQTKIIKTYKWQTSVQKLFVCNINFLKSIWVFYLIALMSQMETNEFVLNFKMSF